MTHEDVLMYWFGALEGPEDRDKEAARKWFQSTAQDDAEMRERFRDVHEKASRGELDAWTETPRGRLALVVLLDQFSRNMWRGTPKAFAQDARAYRLACEGVARGDDQQLWPIERVFLYMPYEHQESPEAQGACLGLMQALVDDTSASALQEVMRGYLRHAHHHHEIIERFGRYPHRNEILGRESTDEEVTYLTEGGARFGQASK